MLTDDMKTCSNCGREYAKRLPRCPRCAGAAKSQETPADREAARRELRARNPIAMGPRSRRERSYSMIDQLGESGGKYARALRGDRLAAFSVIGTEDWQDFASLAYQVMELETALDSDVRLEDISTSLRRIEGLLGTLVSQQAQLLQAQTDSEPSRDRIGDA